MTIRIALAFVAVFVLACAGRASPATPTLPASTVSPVVVAATATLSPIPTSTAAPTPTPMPTPTPSPTPTPEPNLASLFDVKAERVGRIEDPLPKGSEPAILTGCHADSVGADTYAFTESGRLPRSSGADRILSNVIIIKGHFPSLAKGGCYEMVVKATGTGNYRLNFSSRSVLIWHYKLVDYSEGVRRIS